MNSLNGVNGRDYSCNIVLMAIIANQAQMRVIGKLFNIASYALLGKAPISGLSDWS